ncbi:DUF3237 domain-containing protein [Phenylobacterium aquaticum]|uniref:DUF3237 domain-containing protein n=1 Tax=Phenylobacterium aquaticum TaxID=1763816 RepID=UPI0026EFE71B|nr:DUF3237 domain-containing protein [Phenylobacterium aquaticum]
MDTLTSRHLLTLHLDVAFGAMLDIGHTPQGRRRIAPILGGRFEGERLNGEVLPGGADWVINRPDGVMVIDVRLALKTHDSALIYLTYQGTFRAEPEVMKRFNRGGLLEPHEYALRVTPRFECGAEPYRWLNDLPAIGVGEQTAQGPIYRMYEIL